MYLAPVAGPLSVLSLFGVTAAALPTEGNHWVNLTSLPTPRQEHSTVLVNDDTIAVVGGVTAVMNGTVQIDIRTTDLVQLYSISTNSWRTVAPLPIKVNHPNVAAVDGNIYLLGGLIDALDPPGPDLDWQATRDSYVYDLMNDTWTKLPSMRPGTERGSAVMGVYGEMIYVAGGMTALNTEFQDAVTTVTAFNTTSLEWQQPPSIAADIPEGRQHAVGGVVGDTLYVIGGRWFERVNVRDTVFELDLRNLTAGWKTSAGHMPTARGGLNGAVVGDSFFTFGGECNPNASDGVFNQAESFDLKTERWTRLSAMAVPRHGTSAVAAGNRIYIPGGGLQQDGVPVSVNGVVQYSHSTAHFDAYVVSNA